jgi:hypothetical protein
MQRRFSVREPTISYNPRPDATPEVEVTALAAIYKLCLSSHERKGAVAETRPEDARKDRDAGTQSHCT